jgi:hypothetical protein
MIVKSFLPQANKEINALLSRNLTAGVDHLTEAIQEKISIQGVPTDRRSYRGEPPRKETGDLYKGYHSYIDHRQLAAQVGSDQPYDIVLEDENQLDRPHVRVTVQQEANTMASLMTKP